MSNITQLASWLADDTFRTMLVEAERQGPIDKAVAANMLEEIYQNVNWEELEQAMNFVALALTTEHMVNTSDVTFFTTKGKVDMLPLVKAVNPLLLKYHVEIISSVMEKVYVRDWKMRQWMQEDGDLHGIADPTTIINTLAALYAEEKAKASAHQREYASIERWNKQGKGAITSAVTITLGDIKIVAETSRKEDLPALEKPSLIPQMNGLVNFHGQWVIDEATGLPKWAPIIRDTFIDGVTPMESKKGLQANWRDHYVFDEKLQKMVKLAKPKPHLKDWTMADLQQHLTELFLAAIPLNHEQTIDDNKDSPTYGVITYPDANTYQGIVYDEVESEDPITGEKGKILKPRYVPMNENGYKSCYECGVHAKDARYCMQGVPANPNIIDVDFEEVPKMPLGTLESCLQPDGFYQCPRCGKKKLKKNQLKTYLPDKKDKLPDGMPGDDGMLVESRNWAGKVACGTCRDELTNSRSHAKASWLHTNKESQKIADKAADKTKETLPPPPEEVSIPEEYLKQIKEYEDAHIDTEILIEDKEKELGEVQAAIKGLTDAKTDVPSFLPKQEEELRACIQGAKGTLASIQKQLADVNTKVQAVQNGVATPNKARVIERANMQGKPPVAYDLNGPRPKDVSRSVWKDLKRKSAAEARKATSLAA